MPFFQLQTSPGVASPPPRGVGAGPFASVSEADK